MFRTTTSSAALLSLGLLSACVGGGTIHRIGEPAFDALAENNPGEIAEKPTPVVPVWMIEGPRAASGDAKLWALYARAITDAVKKSPEGVVTGDEQGRAEMAKAAGTVGAVTSKYLGTDLPKIAEAGFMEEHARLEFEGGTDSPQAARPDRAVAYIRWRAQNLPDMAPETEVAVLSGRRKIERNPVPWPSVVPAMAHSVKLAIQKNDCASILSAAEILMPAWTQAKAKGGAFSMDADQRHLEYLKKSVKESQNVVMYPTVYRDTAYAAASCSRTNARFDEALERAKLAVEMDPLCSLCWTERAAAHLGLGDKAAAKAAVSTAQETASNPTEQKTAREMQKTVDEM